MCRLLDASGFPGAPIRGRIMFQQYLQNDGNEPILLYEGRFRVEAGDRCVDAWGSTLPRRLPSPGIETDEPVGLDLDSLTVELPDFTTRNVVAYSTEPPRSIGAFAAAMEWGAQQRLLSVGFQIVNFSDLITPKLSAVPRDPTATPNDRQTKQTVDLKHDGWQIRFVACCSAPKVHFHSSGDLNRRNHQ